MNERNKLNILKGNKMTKTTIEISTDEYENLLKDSLFLSALEAAGVGNWCGYDEAFKIFEEMEDAND